MKKLIFVDNDSIERSKRDIKEFVIPFLVSLGKMKEKDIEIEIMSDLYKMDPNKLYEIIYNPENAIISWSSYTLVPDQSNSKQQLLRFLRTADDRVKNCTYIDMSGEIQKTLYHALKYEEIKGVFAILTAIENNNIITRIDGLFVRLKINFTKKSSFDHIPVNIIELLNPEECDATKAFLKYQTHVI